MSNKYYYRRNLITQKEDFVSVTDDLPVDKNAITELIKIEMSKLTIAWYETAKYVLLNNKKQ